MIFTGVKDVIKIWNSAELIIFRIQKSLVFSDLQQSTTFILLKVKFTYSAEMSTLKYLFSTQKSYTHNLNIKVMLKTRVFIFTFIFLLVIIKLPFCQLKSDF